MTSVGVYHSLLHDDPSSRHSVTNIAIVTLILSQAVVDLVDALDAAAAAQSQEQLLQLYQQQGQLLHWLRHKLPTNADLAQVTLLALQACHSRLPSKLTFHACLSCLSC